MPQLPDTSAWSVLAQLGPLTCKCEMVEFEQNPKDFGCILRAVFSFRPDERQALAMAMFAEVPSWRYVAVGVSYSAARRCGESFALAVLGDMMFHLERSVGVRLKLDNTQWFEKEAMRAIIAQRTPARP